MSQRACTSANLQICHGFVSSTPNLLGETFPFLEGFQIPSILFEQDSFKQLLFDLTRFQGRWACAQHLGIEQHAFRGTATADLKARRREARDQQHWQCGLRCRYNASYAHETAGGLEPK